MRFVAVDFERQSLAEELQATGFDASARTATAWLGVVPYLTAEAFLATVALLGNFAPGSSVVFDYSQPREALPLVEQLMLDSLSERVALSGEPFRLFFTPDKLATELGKAGLEVVEDLGGEDLTQRYFTGRRDGLLLRGKAGRICHAKTMSLTDATNARAG